jgi:CHAD domain-containing protein
VRRVDVEAAIVVGEPGGAKDQRCGDVAAALLEERMRRLVALQPDVLADRDPDPLHQMRVACRQLRCSLEQFEPALLLPEQVSPQRVARIGTDLGFARDLDVLRHCLADRWLPSLPDREQVLLRKLLKQLKRERKLAFLVLTETLKGRRYLKLLARLQRWLRDPRFSAMGEEPIAAWIPELQQAAIAGLFTLPGWWATNPDAPDAMDALHLLRRRIKRARYGFSNLVALDPSALKPWLVRFKDLQTELGDLQDLEVLGQTLNRLLDGEMDAAMPSLCSLIAEARQQAWLRWRASSAVLRTPDGRQQLIRLQLLAPAALA